MLSFEEALERVLSAIEPLSSERISLREARGRHVAHDVVAPVSLPGFDYSAMDGYALRAADAASVSTELPVVGESRAGHPAAELSPGTACRIFTGAPLPAGSDCVVLQEDTVREGGRVRIQEVPQIGQHCRRRGEDLRQGEIAILKGSPLTPGRVGLLASLDLAWLEVVRRPRVAIVCTGDELRLPGEPGRPGSLPESNGLAIRALAEGAGASVQLAPLVGDDPNALCRIFRQQLASVDLLISIGGVSVGDYDCVKPALEEAGARLDFWKVAIKPGKPLAFGRAGNTWVLGLPGNPVSAQVTFQLFGLPLLRALLAHPEPKPRFESAVLGAPLEQRGSRHGFYRARKVEGEVVPLDNQASGNVRSLADADVLISMPVGCSKLEPGQLVRVLPVAH